MIENNHKISHQCVLIIHDEFGRATAPARSLALLEKELVSRGVEVIFAPGYQDGRSIFLSEKKIGMILLDWNLKEPGQEGVDCAGKLIDFIRERNGEIPIFLMTDRESVPEIPEKNLMNISEFIWLMEDSAPFLAGRIQAALKKYSSGLLGPMARALIDFDLVHEYSWHTPGHTGGTAFQKSPAGRVFFDYFGEPLFRSDLSISVGELGSLLDHSGPIGEGEKYAANVFGAHRSYTVTNGTSTSNRMIWMACVGRGQDVYVDRNCHKSNEQGITLTGAQPHYLLPTHNLYGLIGPIPPERLRHEYLSKGTKPVHMVITNSTYDGLIYNVNRVLEEIGDSVDRLHFDEAWYAYARFHPLYQGRFAMRGNPADHPSKGPTIFATHSTHKLLAALSQASFIHVRDGRHAISHERFNESFMMHSSTSPCYPIIASNDVSAAMMDGAGGTHLVAESIREAICFRQTVMRLHHENKKRGSWFFKTWNPESLRCGTNGQLVPFQEADPKTLANDPSCWILHPGDAWHGFDLEDDYCMLDPIKVSVLTPGVNPDGSLDPEGFPAALLTSYLDACGIIVEKTSDFAILFLFSIGITNAKWSTLIHALLAFKKDYDANAPLTKAIPALVENYPGAGLRDVGKKMMEQMILGKQLVAQAKAFSCLPEIKMTPADAYQKLVANDVERITLDQAAGRIAATGIVPYPPGIPLVMPGECFGAIDSPFMTYLNVLQNWDRKIPGFSHDIHGIEMSGGDYHLLVVK